MEKLNLVNDKIKCLDKGHVQCQGYYGTDSLIASTARVSTGSSNKGDEQDKKLLKYLYKNHHSSPFEFCNITFLLKCPLFVRDQFVRHRTGKFNIMSLRYQEVEDEFYIPEKWRAQDTKNRQNSLSVDSFNDTSHEELSLILNNQCQSVYTCYKKMIDLGIAKEMARMILPTNLYTMMYIQMDLNNLMKFFKLRCHPHAQYESRMYAWTMYDIFLILFPRCENIFQECNPELWP
jgi:thymidylate synthase (FAD)